VVTIGKNEGERFRRCLASVLERADPIVYVDSGSTDGSVELAQEKGVEVVELDLSQRFTMGRARNAGFRRLMELAPDLEWVMFVDGDAEVVQGWIDRALDVISADDTLAAVYGTRRERYPEASIYNRLADMDWKGQPGEAMYGVGDMLTRAQAVAEVGGYNEAMMAMEDPEIGVRLRQAGYRLLRLEGPMTIHDADMHRFSEWWKRTVRGGHGYAEAAHLYAKGSERHWAKQVRSNWLWGVALPLAILIPAWPSYGLSLLGLLLYPLQGWRVARGRRKAMGEPARDTRLYALFILLSKFPMAWGQALFWVNRWRGKHATLIQYKPAPSPDLAARTGKESHP
jgi:GT2 family glycosyltransferase